ncbi:MAG: polyribonucleotide nucleotidyltransferase [Proteobacteria bacterium]|nr:polyribonucleotide nucleotidyltransferase [Pseudomonadota bacterium]MBU4296798.1 polyribonucleotide nucleotidyltransferase [Pseudomonadota bacterium]MCG2749020.1 polyribonucleotide nucleotidyltransferase [Desulfobulbaceae bacterium]
MYKKVEVEIGGRILSIETGKMAKQANGAVVVSYGDSVVLVTATAAKEPKVDIDFFPLTVEYQERFYAVGRIPGSYFRREIGRPTEKETLTCRFIDRPLRPLFAPGYTNETQIIAMVLSADKENDPDIMAMVGASAALTVSDIPFLGPIAGVRVGYIDGEYVLNPSKEQLTKSRMDLIVAGSRNAVVMVEGGADNLSEEEVLSGIYFGHQGLQPLLDIQEILRQEVGREQIKVQVPVLDVALQQKVAEIATAGMQQVITTADKMKRSELYHELVKEVLAELEKGEDFAGHRAAKEILHDLQKVMMRDMIVKEGKRIDGRGFADIRPISSEIAILPRAHGSALFTRGETQALVSTTLGSGEDEQRVETLGGMENMPFMLHYNFPPFCVGEVRFMRGPSRRDIGHGALATRAIQAVLPDVGSFPYTIRIVSDVMESNGSSSMATVCGGCLSLMDAGVPIKKPVSGVAMGLIKDGETIAVLSDILGDEDHLGDMDFKVCGTADGITALQMDIKIEGISREIMTKALEQAKAGRLHILEKMAEAIGAPREELPEHAPKIFTMQINPDKIRDLIGPGGKMIKAITAEYGVKIDVEDSGKVMIFAPDGIVGQQVYDRVHEITAEVEIGKIYKGTVQKIVDFGAFVEILPGTDGLVHISELEDKRVEKVSDILKEGDEVMVKVLNVDQRGKIRLSRKAAMAELAD